MHHMLCGFFSNIKILMQQAAVTGWLLQPKKPYKLESTSDLCLYGFRLCFLQ